MSPAGAVAAPTGMAQQPFRGPRQTEPLAACGVSMQLSACDCNWAGAGYEDVVELYTRHCGEGSWRGVIVKSMCVTLRITRWTPSWYDLETMFIFVIAHASDKVIANIIRTTGWCFR